MGEAVVTEANHVIGLPLTISTRRVEQKTSKETISDEVPVIAKPRFEEGSQNSRIRLSNHTKSGLYIKNNISSSRTLFLIKWANEGLGLGFSIKILL